MKPTRRLVLRVVALFIIGSLAAFTAPDVCLGNDCDKCSTECFSMTCIPHSQLTKKCECSGGGCTTVIDDSCIE